MTCYCIGVLEPLVADTPRIVAISSADTVHLGVTESPDIPWLWEDWFESGEPITTYYSAQAFGHCETAADHGQSGWGVTSLHADHDSGDQYFADFKRILSRVAQPPDVIVTSGVGTIEGAFNHAASDYATTGYLALAVAKWDEIAGPPYTYSTVLSIVHGIDANHQTLEVYAQQPHPTHFDWPGGVRCYVENIFPASEWHTLRVCFQMATLGADPTDDETGINADGWIEVYVDGASVKRVENLAFGAWIFRDGSWRWVREWDKVEVGPMGDFDAFRFDSRIHVP